MEYKFGEIESKCKVFWEKEGIYKVNIDFDKLKYYVFDMFFYFFGFGFYVGYFFGYIVLDIYFCYKWFKGFNVLYFMGYDVFGLLVE